MPKGSTWIRLGALLTFVTALTCCAALGIRVLHEDKYVKAGIATLRFNFTGIHLPNNPLLMPRTIPGRDILQPLQSEAQSAANVVSTAISPAISKVQSAASAATALPDFNTVKEMIPRNCSLGTKQFCFGFDNRTQCNNLPLNISNIVPEPVASFIGGQFQALQPLPGILEKVTVANIQVCLILGLVLMLVMATIFISSTFGQILCFGSCLLRLGICTGMVAIFITGLICCVPFVIPTVILFTVQSKIQDLPSTIEVQKGDVSNYCLGVLCCGLVMTFLATFSPIFLRVALRQVWKIQWPGYGRI